MPARRSKTYVVSHLDLKLFAISRQLASESPTAQGRFP